MKPLFLTLLLSLSLAGFGQNRYYLGIIDGETGIINYGDTLKDGTGFDGAFALCINPGTHDYSGNGTNVIQLFIKDTLCFVDMGWVKNPVRIDNLQPKLDTIAVVMLVSDTTAMDQVYWTSLGNGLIQKEIISVVSNEIWQMVGYEVSKFVGNEWISTGNDLMAELTPIYEHVAYLNHAKKPLNLCVWGTKERRDK